MSPTDLPAGEPHDPSPSAAALTTLVANHREFLSFLERRVGSRALAEDILQDAFVRGVERIGSLRQEESAIAWFYRALRNAVVDHYRRDATNTRKLEGLAAELDPAEPPSSELHAAVCHCIGELATTLKPEYADALRRIELDGIAVKDYAALAGITSNHAAVRVFRARAALRDRVEKCCGTCADHGCVDCTCAKKDAARD